ncbi:hypothetical protein CoNPh11_CDS0125 [Staphylococcus phage S-CoN_Ph11]|nr:hypothetical protein CoNPh11_CDS0125 [Staphylococcus phage S-CoN_Ph11]
MTEIYLFRLHILLILYLTQTVKICYNICVMR